MALWGNRATRQTLLFAVLAHTTLRWGEGGPSSAQAQVPAHRSDHFHHFVTSDLCLGLITLPHLLARLDGFFQYTLLLVVA